MTSSPSPNFFQIEDIAFWGRSAIISSIWKKRWPAKHFCCKLPWNPRKLFDHYIIGGFYSTKIVINRSQDWVFSLLFDGFLRKAAGPTFFLPHDKCISNRSNESHLLLSGRGPYNGLGPYIVVHYLWGMGWGTCIKPHSWFFATLPLHSELSVKS